MYLEIAHIGKVELPSDVENRIYYLLRGQYSEKMVLDLSKNMELRPGILLVTIGLTTESVCKRILLLWQKILGMSLK